MSNPPAAIIKWLSINGRINRKDYLLLHLLPVFVLFIGGALLFIPGLNYLCGWIALTGIIKRLKDINVKHIGRKIVTGSSALLVIGSILVAVGFIYFLQGISGTGNSNLMEKGLLIVALPLLLIPILPLIIGFIPGSDMPNKYRPVPK